MIFDLNSLNFGYGVQTVIAVSVLMALILVVRGHVARQFGAGVAYALWALPVIRLALPPLSMPTPMADILAGIQSWLPTAANTAEAAPAAMRTADPAGLAPPVISAPPVPGSEPSSPLLDTAQGPVAFPELSAGMFDGMLFWSLLTIWAGGALYMLIRSSWAHHSFMQTLRREEMAPSPHLATLAVEVARQVGLKRVPRVSISFISSGPLVSGLLRPTVLLPAWFEDDYSVPQQRAALAHELTHIKRGDLWALQVSEIFVSLLWFNPLAYLARRAFRTDQEAACDSDVLKSGASTPHAYGQTLLKAVQLALPERLTAAASLPLTHALKERMIRMTTPSPSRSRRLVGAGLSGLLGSTALFASGFVTSACASAEVDTQVDRAELAGGEDDSKIVKETHSLRFNDGTLFINGDEVKDRQVVLVGEPFRVDPMTPRLEREIEILTLKIENETAHLNAMLENMPEIDMAFDGFDEELNRKMELAFSFTEETMPKTEAEWEAWAHKVEAEAERWEIHAERIADQAEARVEAWEARFEPKLDAIEARIEAHADALERKIELAYGDEFEDEIETTHLALTELVEQCRTADMAEGETRVLKQQVGDSRKKDVKIVCVKGDKDTLKAKTTIKAVLSSDKLDAKEKTSFKKQLKGTSTHTITIDTETSDEK